MALVASARRAWIRVNTQRVIAVSVLLLGVYATTISWLGGILIGNAFFLLTPSIQRDVRYSAWLMIEIAAVMVVLGGVCVLLGIGPSLTVTEIVYGAW